MSKALTADKDTIVHFHYVMRDSDGREVESSRNDEPVAALIGHDNLMAGLEKALQGHSAGARFETTLEPADAFGTRREDWTQRVSKKYVANAARLKPGSSTELQTESGARTVTVIKVGGKFLDVDLNHPLAGQRVTFDVEVIDVRQATQDEIAHGHAHGAGGHHH